LEIASRGEPGREVVFTFSILSMIPQSAENGRVDEDTGTGTMTVTEVSDTMIESNAIDNVEMRKQVLMRAYTTTMKQLWRLELVKVMDDQGLAHLVATLGIMPTIDEFISAVLIRESCSQTGVVMVEDYGIEVHHPLGTRRERGTIIDDVETPQLQRIENKPRLSKLDSAKKSLQKNSSQVN
jgi:hypothetical protein